MRAEEPLVLLGSGTSQAPPADTVQLQQDFRLSVLADRPKFSFPLAAALQRVEILEVGGVVFARRVDR